MFLLVDWRASGAFVVILVESAISGPAAIMFVRQASKLGMLDQLRPNRAPPRATLGMPAAVLALQPIMTSRISPPVAHTACTVTGAADYPGLMTVAGSGKSLQWAT